MSLASRGQVQWSVETSKNIIDSVKTGVHNKMQETLMSIKGTYVGDTQKVGRVFWCVGLDAGLAVVVAV